MHLQVYRAGLGTFSHVRGETNVNKWGIEILLLLFLDSLKKMTSALVVDL